MDKQRINKIIKKVWSYLEYKRKKDFILLIIIMVLSAIFEIISIGAILPFMTLLMDTDKIEIFYKGFIEWKKIKVIDEKFGVTVLFLSLVIISSIIKIIMIKMSANLSFLSGADLSALAYEKTLLQDYNIHINRNSSKVIAAITQKIGNTIAFIYNTLNLISSMIFFILTISILLFIKPEITMIGALFIIMIYMLISKYVTIKLEINSMKISMNQTKIIKNLQEGMGGIKEIILSGAHLKYLNEYKEIDRELRKSSAENTFISQSPKYIIELIALIGLSIIAYKLSINSELKNSIPVIAGLTIAMQRLLPATQLIYNSWANMKGNINSVEEALELLDQKIIINKKENMQIKFENEIKLIDINFSYNKKKKILNNLSLEIKKGTILGVIGKTGGGKSTLINIILCLLKPDTGYIEVDKIKITEVNKRSWQKMISHVPQKIYLTDASIAENIAFGIKKEEIDLTRVKLAAEKAEISQYIETLPGKYNENIGEMGIQLSGGQCQRIGIARALYKESAILILDEATSALDMQTEKNIVNTLIKLSENMTIILITHRESTIKECSNIIEIDNGEIKYSGKYEEMQKLSKLV